MTQSAETIRVMWALQGFLTLILLALFWTLQSRFRRTVFLRLWCGAWAAYFVGLLAGFLPLLAPMPAGPGAYILVWLFCVAGFVQAVLIYLGTRAFLREDVPSFSAWKWVIAAAVTATALCVLSILYPERIAEWLGGAQPFEAYILRIAPRQAVLAIAYVLSAWIFWQRRQRGKLPAAQILASASLFYGAFQGFHGVQQARSIWLPQSAATAIPPYFVDIACQMLFGVGIVLMLLEEYRSALESRREVEARFGGVAQSLGEGLLITDADDVILFANEQIAAMTGYSVSELVGRPGYALLLAETNWPVLWKKNKERLSGATERYEMELRRKDGSPIWVEISASPYRNIAGEIIGTLGAITDITIRRRHAAELAASEEKFSKAFLSSPDAVAISRLEDGRFLDVNDSFCKLFGYKREELIGSSSPLLGLWIDRKERERLKKEVDLNRPLRDFRTQFRNKSGEILEAEVSAALVEIGGQQCLLTFTRDVTAQSRADRLQTALYEIAHAADRSPDLNTLFGEVHQIIRQVMSAENLYIALYDEATDTLTFPYFADAHDQPSPPGPPGRGNTAYVLRTGNSLLSPVEVHEDLKQRGEVETVGVMSQVWLGVPLKSGEKCIGVMAVQHYSDKRAYGEREQRILEYVSSQVATAIQRKRAEEALRGSEEKFSRAFHSSADAMAISTFDDSRFIEVNESFLRLTGFGRGEVLGQTSNGLGLWVHPERRPEMSAKVRATGRVEDFELELRRKDGAVVIGLLSVDVIEVGGRKCFLSVVRDITVRKRMEEALRQSEAKFSKTFFASPDAMVISTLEGGTFVEVNEGFCRLSGYTREETIGHTGLELGLWSSAEDRNRVIVELRSARGVRNMEFAFRAKSGRTVVGLLSAEVIEFGGTKCMLVVVRDITERKEMEEALRTSEERFRELFENANDIVYTHDLDGHFTSLNRTGERITGYSRNEAMQMSLQDLLAPEQLAFAKRMVQAKVEGRGPTTYELQIKAKDGHTVDLEVSTRIVLFDGKPVGVQGIARDITERRRAQAALRDSEERYRLLFKGTPLPMLVYDTESLEFLDVNEAAVRSYGYSREEFLGMTLKDIRPPEEIHYLMGKLGVVSPNVHAAVHRRKDGTLIDVEIRAHPVDLFGRAARLVIADDITDRLRSEQAMRESESKFRTLAESSPYAILIMRDGSVIFSNHATEEITGYSKAELAKLEAPQIVSPASLRLVEEKRTERRAGLKEPQRFEIKITTKSGAEKWLDVTTNLISFEGSNAALVNAMDVTERKAVEDQLRQAQKMEAVGRLAGGVAHDFNNLLMIMRGYADLILDSEEAGETNRRNAEQITKAADRAAGLTQQLLAFSRKQVLAPQVLDLSKVVRGVESMLKRLIGEDVELVTAAAQNLWTVKADPNQIEQVLLNLAINARDAMPRGGKLMIEMRNVELDSYFVRRHAGASSGPHVLLSVSDTGEGMTPEVRARVFEPFFTTKGVGRGTGLGLATVYGIVKQSNGYITVYSEVGKGTTFKVYLPRATETSELQLEAEAVKGSGGHETILLVEDEADVRELARQFLDSRGYRVLEAHDGNEALRISGGHAGHIDLLVTDVVMPGMSGKELADRVVRARPETKVLYVSGYTAEAIGHHGILDPGTEFLQKPFSREALARKLREVLDGHSAKHS